MALTVREVLEKQAKQLESQIRSAQKRLEEMKQLLGQQEDTRQMAIPNHKAGK